MIKVDWPLFLKRLGYFLGFLLVIFLLQTHINNQVTTRTQNIIEKTAQEKAELAKQLEADKINERAICQKEIVELKSQLEKAKILLDKMQKQKTYSTMVKKDVQSFIDEVNVLFDLKGKKDDKK